MDGRNAQIAICAYFNDYMETTYRNQNHNSSAQIMTNALANNVSRCFSLVPSDSRNLSRAQFITHETGWLNHGNNTIFAN